MKILIIGDIVGTRAITYLKQNLWKLRDRIGADFVIANGENASEIHGLSAAHAREILDAGVDLITMGNHTFGKRDIYAFLDAEPEHIIRPANYPGSAPGYSSYIASICGYKVLCMNVLGQAFMDPVGDPFDAVEFILAREDGNFDISILDVHAEATSEKYAIARVFDGRINIMFGTHTHVQTADEQILPGGSAYITDIGMTGPQNGILGTDTSRVLTRIRDHMPAQFIPADGEIKGMGIIVELDGNKPKSISRITF